MCINGTAQGYDMEGNQLAMQLTAGAPIVSMGWDSENRMTSTQNDVSTGAARIDNRYDPLHRRVLKQVSTWNGVSGQWEIHKTIRFTYDGCAELLGGQRVRRHIVQPFRARRAWGASESNVIEEEEVTAARTRTVRYTWGADVSGSLQGAGGVGGLLRSDAPTRGPEGSQTATEGSSPTGAKARMERRGQIIDANPSTTHYY
jgi:hypothetical protein